MTFCSDLLCKATFQAARGLLVGLFGAMVLLSLGWSLSAEAAPLCRQVEVHEVCILTIQRSAKYFWEYRAAVTVDGQKRPLEKYDCRQRVHLRKDGKSIPFAQDPVGDFICTITR